MEAAPILRTMSRDYDLARARFPKGLIALVFFVLVFLVAIWFVFAYITQEVPTTPVVQTAAAAAIDPFAHTTVDAKSAVVLDITDNKILFTSNREAQLPLASITKIALALVVSDVLPLDSIITVNRDISGNGKGQTLRQGTSWRVRDLIDYMLIASSNDAANFLAEEVDEPLRARFPNAPRGEAAVWRMNNLMQELGLAHTYFLNPSGLDESETQAGAYGTSEDIANLFAYAAKAPDVFSATNKASIAITSQQGETITASNTDEALPDIPGLIMGKTGLTDLAGGNLGVVFTAGHTYAVIVLGSTKDGRFGDVKTLAKVVASGQ